MQRSDGSMSDLKEVCEALERARADGSLGELMAELAGTSFCPKEFGYSCAMGLALGDRVQTDGTIRAQFDGSELCFRSKFAKAAFMKDPEGNLAKARAYWWPATA
jgi:hypothetical protein